MTSRQELFANGILQGKTQKQAAIDAGYTAVNAHIAGSKLMHDQNFREKLKNLMLERGLTADYAVGKLKGLIEAETVILMGKEKDTPLNIPDGATRAKGMDMYLKVMGGYPDPRVDINANVVATVIVRSTDEIGLDPFAADVIEGKVVEQETPLLHE